MGRKWRADGRTSQTVFTHRDYDTVVSQFDLLDGFRSIPGYP